MCLDGRRIAQAACKDSHAKWSSVVAYSLIEECFRNLGCKEVKAYDDYHQEENEWWQAAAVKNACDSPGQTRRWLGTEVARVRARERKGAGYA